MQISAANYTISPLSAESTELAAAKPAATRPAVPAPDPTSLRRVADLLAQLENKPEVRPEVLARGRALAANPLYPPPDIINKLAGLIVSTVR